MKADPVGSLEYFETQGGNDKESHTNRDNGTNGHTDGASKKRARVN